VNPARLAELNHQRALVREQLAWLDREIAAESANLPPPTAAAAAHAAPKTPSISSLELQAAEAYQPDPVSTSRDTRKGCFIAIAVMALLMIAAFAAIYVIHYSDRSLFFVSGEDNSASERPPSSAPPSK
jgi:hypothetical protein